MNMDRTGKPDLTIPIPSGEEGPGGTERNAEMSKCRNVKMSKRRNDEMSTGRKAETPKRRNVEMREKDWWATWKAVLISSGVVAGKEGSSMRVGGGAKNGRPGSLHDGRQVCEKSHRSWVTRAAASRLSAVPANLSSCCEKHPQAGIDYTTAILTATRPAVNALLDGKL